MENKDDIFEQFKTAANSAEQKEFAAKDKVWNRVENKLDNKLLTKENTFWRKLAVAASVLLVASIGYQYLKEDKINITPTNDVVVIHTLKTITDNTTNNDIVTVEKKQNPAINANAEMILKEQINTQSQVVVRDTLRRMMPKMIVSKSESIAESDDLMELQKPAATVANSYDSYNGIAKRKDNVRGVKQHEGYLNYSGDAKEAKQTSKKEAPLLVIDDKVSDTQTLGKLDPKDLENIILLPNPLYIINGIEYTEKELFGPNPTSPYAPLSQQNIETLSILQNEKATEVYGEKGKKGVVIIATKGGIPAAKKK